MNKRSYSFSIILLSFVLLVFFSGCSKIFYGNANTSGPASYVPMPSIKDSSKTNHFIGTGFSHSHPNRSYFQDEYSYFGSLDYTNAWRIKSNFLLINLSGYKGNYFVQKIEDEKGLKSFWGTGAKIEFSHFEKYEKFNIHFGLRTSAFYEGGQYRRFRNDAELISILETDRGDYHKAGVVYSIGSSVGITYNGNGYDLGVSAFTGLDPMLLLITVLPDLQLGLNLHFTFRNITFAVETTESRLNGYLFRTGLYYRL